MKNKSKNKEWGLSHPVICCDLLRSLCLNLGWDLCPAPCPQLSTSKCFFIGSQGGNPTIRGLFIGSSPSFITKQVFLDFIWGKKKTTKSKNSKSHDLQPHGESETELNRRIGAKKKKEREDRSIRYSCMLRCTPDATQITHRESYSTRLHDNKPGIRTASS